LAAGSGKPAKAMNITKVNAIPIGFLNLRIFIIPPCPNTWELEKCHQPVIEVQPVS
jgi:hypothetical protein